jgi:TolA-binding protein
MSDGPLAAGEPTIEESAGERDMPTLRELKDLRSQIQELREKLEQNNKEVEAVKERLQSAEHLLEEREFIKLFTALWTTLTSPLHSQLGVSATSGQSIESGDESSQNESTTTAQSSSRGSTESQLGNRRTQA